MAGELLELPHGVMGIALNLEEDSVGAVLMGEVSGSRKATRSSAPAASCPCPWASHGWRVVNARTTHRRQRPHRHKQLNPIEVIAPGVVDRQPVREPLETGIKAIDSMVNIAAASAARHRRSPDRQDHHPRGHDQPEGQGRRLHLRGRRQKQSTIAQVVKTLDDFGAMEHTVVVSAAPPSPPLPLHRPYAGCAIGSTFATRDSTARRLRRPLQARGRIP